MLTDRAIDVNLLIYRKESCKRFICHTWALSLYHHQKSTATPLKSCHCSAHYNILLLYFILFYFIEIIITRLLLDLSSPSSSSSIMPSLTFQIVNGKTFTIIVVISTSQHQRGFPLHDKYAIPAKSSAQRLIHYHRFVSPPRPPATSLQAYRTLLASAALRPGPRRLFRVNRNT